MVRIENLVSFRPTEANRIDLMSMLIICTRSVIQEIPHSDHNVDFEQIQAKNVMMVRIENFVSYTIITPKILSDYHIIS